MSDEGKGNETPLWLLTYGDMVTLLVTFFVMLISLSTINVDKYKKIMSEVQKTFVGDGGEFLLEDGTNPLENPFENELDTLESPEVAEPIEEFVDTKEMYHYLSNFLEENKLARYVNIEDIKIGCKIEIPLNLCFEMGESTVKREAYPILEELGTALRNIRGRIVIDTNMGTAIKPGMVETDLSVDRSASICDFLMTKEHIEPRRVAIAGYSSTYASKDDTIGIIILKK